MSTTDIEYLATTVLNIDRQSDFESLRDLVVSWAEDKEIFTKATPLSQQVKTQEEVNELLHALLTNNREEVIDSIGDILVTLIIQAEMNGLDIVDCLGSAYRVISKRTGKMVNGIFVKDEGGE